MLWWLRIRASFFCLESCLIAYSLFIASCFVSYSSKYTSSTGRRFFVYLAPFPTVMCFQPFLKIIRPAGVQSFITAFYNVCIVSLMLVLFVSFFHYLLPIIAFLLFSFLLFYCFILLPFL